MTAPRATARRLRCCSTTPPTARGERPQDHLRVFRGFLQADGYAGYSRLYGSEIVEVACWAHARRKFH